MKSLITRLIEHENLSSEDCEHVIEEIIQGADPYQAAAFLALMRAKGETAEELLGVVHAMEHHMISVEIPSSVIDIVGTGGDHSNSVNISTGSSLLAAACGVKVAKHGNRASSSKCGSADVLEELGIPLEIPPEKVVEAVEAVGIGFMFAPYYHPSFKKITSIRRGLQVRTLFNLIGPLLNPCSPDFLMVGVADDALLEVFADVIRGLNVKRALVFFGNGMDELTPVGPCQVIEISGEDKMRFVLDPKKLGFETCSVEDLRGGDAPLNAQLLLEALSGKAGPISDTLILNAGVALYVYGLAETIEEGILLARKKQRAGAAIQILEEWKTL